LKFEAGRKKGESKEVRRRPAKRDHQQDRTWWDVMVGKKLEV